MRRERLRLHFLESRHTGIGRGVDVLEELDPLLVPMPRHAAVDHQSLGHEQRRKQCVEKNGWVDLVVLGVLGTVMLVLALVVPHH